MHIPPSLGRKVWFFPNRAINQYLTVINPERPMDAVIVYVLDDNFVNLQVRDHYGHSFAFQAVRLVQEGEAKPDKEPFCCWMPYQKGQAKLAEADALKLNQENTSERSDTTS